MQKRYDPESFKFNQNQELEHNEENKKQNTENGEDSKTPKYDKNLDFFDNITNSTLEEKSMP